jgi:hypothetical protein
MSKFANLKARSAPAPQPAKPTQVLRERVSPIAPSRENKKQIAGYFSQDLHKELATLAAKEGMKVQALLGEALDMLLHSRGLHTFNER